MTLSQQDELKVLRAELARKNTALINKNDEIAEITMLLDRYREDFEAGARKIDNDDKIEEKLISVKKEKGINEIKESCSYCKKIKSTEIKMFVCKQCKIIK